jgi:hypothetical protein
MAKTWRAGLVSVVKVGKEKPAARKLKVVKASSRYNLS